MTTFIITLLRASGRVLPLLAALCLGSTPVASQEVPSVVMKIPSVQTMFSEFERQNRTNDNFTTQGSGAISYVLRRWSSYPSAMVDSIINGLEHRALHSNDPITRADAVTLLSIAGQGDMQRPMPGIFGRLQRIYRESNDRKVRLAVMDVMLRTSERGPAVAFLRRVAVQPQAKQDFPGAAEEAVWYLAMIGEEGSAMLRELQRQNLVKDPDARSKLELAARRGFDLRKPK
jgi:hypothetical protein